MNKPQQEIYRRLESNLAFLRPSQYLVDKDETQYMDTVKSAYAVVLCSTHPTFPDLMDCSQPGFSVHGILQARILNGLPIPFPGDLPDPGIDFYVSCIFCIADRFFTPEPPRNPKQ